MRFYPILATMALGVLLSGSLLGWPSVRAQAPGAPAAGARPEPVTDELVQASRLDAAALEMREYLKKMRLHAVKYHLIEDKAQIAPMQSEWRSMLATGHKLHNKMVQAAIADFKDNPKLDGQAAEFLVQVTGRNADKDRVDDMFELVNLLKDHGYSSKQFDLCYGLTAAANNQYEAARPSLMSAAVNLEQGLKELADTPKLSEEERKTIGKKFIETYELVRDLAEPGRYQPLWEEELKARQKDAEGEPLPRVLIETTKGSFEVELFENNAPNTVANFISLCEQGYYDKLPFHRVLTHFMAQGGDPNRDGTGGPGYAIRTELNGKTDRKFFRGTLGMAMSNMPDSGGSQFFICYLPRAHLNGKYVAFGRVVQGMDIVSDLAHINPEDKKDEADPQDTPDEIISTKVLQKRKHDYKVEKLPEIRPPVQ